MTNRNPSASSNPHCLREDISLRNRDATTSRTRIFHTEAYGATFNIIALLPAINPNSRAVSLLMFAPLAATGARSHRLRWTSCAIARMIRSRSKESIAATKSFAAFSSSPGTILLPARAYMASLLPSPASSHRTRRRLSPPLPSGGRRPSYESRDRRPGDATPGCVVSRFPASLVRGTKPSVFKTQNPDFNTESRFLTPYTLKHTFYISKSLRKRT
jgi:hypothetical protein